jgi:hypothetical protein
MSRKRNTDTSTTVVVAKRARLAASDLSRGRGSARSNLFVSSPDWQQNLEDNLIKYGYTRAKARSLVKFAAS